MSSKKSDPQVLPPEPKRGPGQPSKYRPEFCRMLVEHQKQGGSIESFAGVCGVAISSIYVWFEAHAEFSEARKEAEGHLHKFYEEMGKMLATGQIRRVKSEEPVLDPEGKPVLDPRTGNVLMKREYEPVTGNATAWIFLCKNMLGWNDKRIIHMAPQSSGDTRRADSLTPEQRMKEIQEMTTAIAELETSERNSSGESAS